MSAGIVIIGGGVAGVRTANLLAARLPAARAHIRLLDAGGRHAYQPAWPSVALDGADPGRFSRDVRSLLHPRVDPVLDEARRLDPTAGKVWLESGATMSYDYAVLATGTRIDRDAVPGLEEGTHDCYSVEGALRLREALGSFAGGTVVVGIAGVPYPCPPAPVEFALRLDEWLRRRGLRDRTAMRYLSPLNRAFPIEGPSREIEPILEERGIAVHTFVNVEEVDPAGRRLYSLEGESFDYDLAVLVPPHRGSRLVTDSGLGDPGGWVPTDPASLKVRGYDRLFALGDATDLPISKAGSTAHFEAGVVAEQVAAAIEGREPDPDAGTYRGRVVCFLGVGRGRTAVIQFDADHPPHLSGPSRLWTAARRAFRAAYWRTMRTGLAFRAQRLLPRGPR
ncbi:MAG: FAD-dependent oxidoreductase [Actinobacteria bacterium]|nr:FAD-dependent oxidoreductase [Actinomycetota bacterium]